ncbi:spaetzle-processing enzyme [Folsomia candida]|uniref:spaetzle-processing enzyme n=1 Tax=Folsomia candida TaxID=158441 RepID=UPI000B8FBAFD|nr:spaetzle-processing enzyme [Folsomia candida]
MHISNFTNIFLIIIWFTELGYCLEPQCNAIYLGVDGYVPGKCVTFHECPPLKGLLRSSTLTAAEIKLLQNLTCTIHPEIPTICCALKDIPDLTNYNEPSLQGNKPSKSPSIEDIIIYPGSPSDRPRYPSPSSPNSINNGDVKLTPSSSPTVIDANADIELKKFKLLFPKLDECGLSAIDTSLRIVGGKNAEHGAYPWMARIGYQSLDTGDIEFYCGGTVISNKYILTAAHCSEEVDKTELKVAVIRLGEYNANSELDCSPDSAPEVNCSRAVDFPIEKIIHHPGYSLENKTNDIELIRVKGIIPFDTPFVKPVCLPFVTEYGIESSYIREDVEDKDQFVGKKGVVTGWGRIKWNKVDGSDILQEIKLPIVSNNECQRNYSTKIQLWDKQMCAGGLVAEDSCGGDSGSPILIPIPMKVSIQSRHSAKFSTKFRPKYFQLGVVSFGPTHCGVGGLPGVYTRIAAYKNWILENMEP